MTDNTENIVKNRDTFSQDSVGWLRIIILIQIIFIVFQVGFILLQIKNKPQPKYFPLNNQDQLINTVPLNQPALTDAELLNWLTEAMISSFSFNYHNYSKIADKIEEYFDPVGIESYLNMIKSNKQLQQIVSKKLILSGRPTAAPRIIQEEIVRGKYAWQIYLPFIFKFNNQKINAKTEVTLDLLVVRVPEQESPLGVKIVGIKIKE